MSNKKQQLRSILIYAALACVIAVVATVVFEAPVQAQDGAGVQQAEQSGLSGSDPRLIAARIIQAALGVLGIVVLGLLVYAGYLWMTAEGDQEQIGRAKRFLRNGLVGLVFIVSALGVVTYIYNVLAPDQALPPTPSSQETGTGGFGSGGAFALGVISSHYPARGQTDLARNTNVMVSFTEEMRVDSIVNNGGTPNDTSDDTVNENNIRILRADADPESGPFVQANVSVTDDKRGFVFDPVNLLGSSEENTLYRVVLGEGVLTSNGSSAFEGGGSYQWQFEVGTFVDEEPPQIESIAPQDGSTHPRNVVIQITFTEAMNPATVTGQVANEFNNITVQNDAGPVRGRFRISNQYRTVEFVTDNVCGQNSCEEDVYCLPGDSTVNAEIRAATVSPSPPAASFPFDGVTDAAGNSFDGNQDGIAQGPEADSFAWTFQTNDQIDLTAPEIVSVTPNTFATQASLQDPIRATFSKPLQFSTITRQSVSVNGLSDYQLAAFTQEGQSTIRINHDGLAEETVYTPSITSDVRGLYQNCYRPCVGP